MFLQSIYYTSLNDADKAQAYIQELIPGVKLIPRMLVSKYYRVSFETEETLSFWIKLTISENTNYVMFAWDEVLELEKEPTIK